MDILQSIIDSLMSPLLPLAPNKVLPGDNVNKAILPATMKTAQDQLIAGQPAPDAVAMIVNYNTFVTHYHTACTFLSALFVQFVDFRSPSGKHITASVRLIIAFLIKFEQFNITRSDMMKSMSTTETHQFHYGMKELLNTSKSIFFDTNKHIKLTQSFHDGLTYQFPTPCTQELYNSCLDYGERVRDWNNTVTQASVSFVTRNQRRFAAIAANMHLMQPENNITFYFAYRADVQQLKAIRDAFPATPDVSTLN
jgi:hypothetical protein